MQTTNFLVLLSNCDLEISFTSLLLPDLCFFHVFFFIGCLCIFKRGEDFVCQLNEKFIYYLFVDAFMENIPGIVPLCCALEIVS